MTLGQLSVMFDQAMARQYDRMRFTAALHGVDLDKQSGKTPDPGPGTPEPTGADREIVPFGAPEDYTHMSPEEREALTRKMMAGHRKWVENQKLKHRFKGFRAPVGG